MRTVAQWLSGHHASRDSWWKTQWIIAWTLYWLRHMTTPFLVFSKNNTLQFPTFKSPDFQSCNSQSSIWAGLGPAIYTHPPAKRICLRCILMLSSDIIGGDLWNWYWTFLLYERFEVTGLLPWDYYHSNGCVYSWCGHTVYCLLCQDNRMVNKVQTNVKTVVCQLNCYWCAHAACISVTEWLPSAVSGRAEFDLTTSCEL
jgi:hypothetical protein